MNIFKKIFLLFKNKEKQKVNKSYLGLINFASPFGIYNISGYNLWSNVKGYIWRAIDIIAQTVAAQQLSLYRIQANGKKKRINSHELLDILNNINENVNLYEFLYILTTQSKIFGNSFWKIDKDGIWNLDPREVTVNTSQDYKTKILSYDFQGSRYLPKQILHFKNINIVTPEGEGQSDLVYIWEYIKQQSLLLKSRTSSLESGGVPPFLLRLNSDLGENAGVILKRLQDELMSYISGPQNVGRGVVIPKEIDLVPVSTTSPKDLEFSEAVKVLREDIASLLGVPKTKLGLMEDSNRASSIIASQTFMENTIIPILKSLEFFFNREVKDKIYRGADSYKLKFEFDINEITDPELEIKRNTEYLNTGVITINEVRNKLGLSSVSWGNKPLPLVQLEANTYGVIDYTPDELKQIQEQISKKIDDEIDKFSGIDKDFPLFLGETVRSILIGLGITIRDILKFKNKDEAIQFIMKQISILGGKEYAREDI